MIAESSGCCMLGKQLKTGENYLNNSNQYEEGYSDSWLPKQNVCFIILCTQY